jgi:hypothetical protein
MSPVSTPRDVKPVQANAKEKTDLYGVDTESIGFHLLPASRRAELAKVAEIPRMRKCVVRGQETTNEQLK